MTGGIYDGVTGDVNDGVNDTVAAGPAERGAAMPSVKYGDVFAGILAAGTGTRMGADRPKQFLELDGVPILVRTVDVFRRVDRFESIIVAAASGWESFAENMLRSHFPDDGRIKVITGGSDRTGSILRVIDGIERSAGNIDGRILVTHDAARPFADSDMILGSIEAAMRYGCAGTAVPSVDTVFSSRDGETIDDIPPRSAMFCMQTPQTFRIGLFRRALASLDPRQLAEVTDVCGVFARAGMPVGFVHGSRNNIKITEPSDMAFARVVLRPEDS